MSRRTPDVDRSLSHWATVSTITMVVCLGLLACRLVYIDTTAGRKLTDHRDRQQSRNIELTARRGLIVDNRGRILAGSAQSRSVFADPQLIPDEFTTARLLCTVLTLDPDELAARFAAVRERGGRFMWLARRITDIEEQALQGFRRQGKLPGIRLVPEPRRVYPNGPALAQVIGFVNRDDKGLEGLERYYDTTLAGRPGSRTVRCANNRRAIWSDTRDIAEPEQGFHIVLTIDLVIQELLEARVARVIEEFAADSAVGIVIDPRTGDVLAMTSQPTFDPNEFQSSDMALYRNRCLTDPVEPGSVFKPFIVAAALSEGLATADERIDCGEGYHFFGKRRIRDTHPNGVLTVEQILVKSSNIGMGQLAERLGNRRIRDYVTAFGFGRPTDIDLPGESGGIVKSLSQWSSYSKQSVAIGQELAVTPLQLAVGFGALVNGGTLYRPRVVARIIDPETMAHYEQPPAPVAQVLDPRIAHTVAQQMMLRVVNESHHDLRSPRYSIIGKTGTAQIPRSDRPGYEPDAYLASFIGAAPADDPRLVALIMVRKPSIGKGYYGGMVAGPAVRDVLHSSLLQLDVPPDKPSSIHVGAPPDVTAGYAGLGPPAGTP